MPHNHWHQCDSTRWDGATLVGLTPTGRVTVALLHINDEYRVELREIMIEAGEFPPVP